MSPGQRELPTIPEEVTAAWLEPKLGHEIKEVDLTKVIYGTETKLFFTISYSENDEEADRPTQICIKGCFDPAMVAAQPWTVTLAQREAEFYTKMAPNVKQSK